MKTFIESLQGSEMNMYDSKTRKILHVKKAVDLTHLCKDAKQVVIKYAKAKRGLIAQINDLYKPNEDLGVCVHYFLNETSAKRLSEDEVFNLRAKSMGANPYQLALEIYLNSK